MHILKIKGPSIETWGMPERTFAESLIYELTIVLGSCPLGKQR